MMKRISFLFFTIAISSLSVLGQGRVDSYSTSTGPQVSGLVSLPSGNSWEAKHFREALSNGREYQGYYVLVNEGKKVVKPEELIQFCKANDYYWLEEYKTKEISKFGDFDTSIYKFWFIPKSLYILYVFDWTDRFYKKADDLKSKGSVYFFNPYSNRFMCLENTALWTGSVSNGYINGTGAGIWQKDSQTYYYFNGTFKNGFPVGKAIFRIVETKSGIAWGYSPREKTPKGNWGNGAPFIEVEVGEMHDGMALFRYLDNGEGHSVGNRNELYGYVRQDGQIAIKPQFRNAFDFNGGRAIVRNDKDEEIYISKNGQFIDYTDGQKRVNAQRTRKAEEYRRAVEANKDPRRWSVGCKLCYRFPNSNDFVIARLEEWNSDKSRIKITILASPSASRQLHGEYLKKNNQFYIDTPPNDKDGWHLALEEEIEIAARNDHS